MSPEENGKSLEDPSHYPALVSGVSTSKNGQQKDGGEVPGQVVVSPDEEKGAQEPAFKEDPDFEHRVASLRQGTGEVRIRGLDLLDERLQSVGAVASGSTITVRVYLEYLEAVKDSSLIVSLREKAPPQRAEEKSEFYGPNLGYVLELYERYGKDPESVDEQAREFFETWSPPRVEANGRPPSIAGELFSASTTLERGPLEEMEKGERVVADFTFEVPLRRGRYSIGAGVRSGGEDSYLDRVDVAATLRIKRSRDQMSSQGIVHLPTRVKVHTPEGERQGRSA